MTIGQALKLVVMMDEKLKRGDFKHGHNLGVNFGGYWQSMAARQAPGCTKLECVVAVVRAIAEPSGLGIHREDAEAFLDARVPGWRDL